MKYKFSLYISIFLFLFSFFSISCYLDKDTKVFLTEEEKEWLNEYKGKITIGYTIDYPPIEFLKNDEYVGISADYFKLLEKKLNIEIKMLRYESWTELLNDAKDRKISGITAATKTENRAKYLNFTIPYIYNPNIIVTRKNFSEKLNFEKLENSTISVLALEAYSILEYLDINYPNLNYKTVRTAKEGLRKVSFGEADALIVQLISASTGIEEDNITNLIFNSETSYSTNLSIASRNDWPILNDIFNKGLAQITENERKEIMEKWLPFFRESIFDKPIFWISLGIVFFLLFIIFISIFLWNITLKKLVREKTAELEKSKEMLIFKSYHDELTKLYNRAYYNEKLEFYEKNPQLPLSIIIADLNGLKITNDTLGHEDGDNLIKSVAHMLKKNCRNADTIARIGGDEFVVLLPKTDYEELDKIVQEIKIDCNNSPKNPIPISLAIGYATQIDSKENIKTIFKKAEDLMYENKIHESNKTYANIIHTLKERLEKNTAENQEHFLNLKKLSQEIGKKLNFSEEELNILAKIAELHDIGLVAIPFDILNKKGELTKLERNKIERHPDFGFRIASSAKMLEVGEGILAHHEHWDGSGYPNGLKEKKIPIFSRIISIVDAYDVMINGRPYKQAVSKSEAIKELKRCAGTQFDPEIVDLFINYII